MSYTAIYLRVSTDQQDFACQQFDLEQWVKLHPNEKVRWYRDKFTGKTMNRPGMDKMMDDLQAGKLSRIVCWRLDRLGRTASGLTKLFDDLRLYGCNLISLKDNLDLSTPPGRLNANIIASVASYETEIRAERVLAGQEAARKRGKRWGGSRRGHRKSRTAERVGSVLKLYREGTSKAEISRAVSLSIPTIYSIIRKCG